MTSNKRSGTGCNQRRDSTGLAQVRHIVSIAEERITKELLEVIATPLGRVLNLSRLPSLLSQLDDRLLNQLQEPYLLLQLTLIRHHQYRSHCFVEGQVWVHAAGVVLEQVLGVLQFNELVNFYRTFHRRLNGL